MSSNFYEILKNQIDKINYQSEFKTTGKVLQIMDGIAYVYGLEQGKISEKVRFASDDTFGIILNIEENICGVVVIGSEGKVRQGDFVYLTEDTFAVGVGPELLGRVVDATGNPIDGLGPIKAKTKYHIERPAPEIMHRQSVHEPLMTGITAIDSLVPIGKGQRELIIGDRQTGKTSIALDTIINQRSLHESNSSEAVYCVYVAIGQKSSSVMRLKNKLEKAGAMKYSVIVLATASDIAAYQYFAPYVGCSIAEWFRDNGKHALIIYDDLTKHAVAYREISLLLRRPPGREAFPADVFYIHSRLLERSAKLSKKYKSGSLTALPIIETQAGDISAYIPTNVISITDGQIFLQQNLFNKSIKPAIDVGLSVSRVGGDAQFKVMKQVTGSMKSDIAQYREMQSFAQFGAEVDNETKKIINRGDKITHILLQDENNPRSLNDQILILFLANNGHLDHLEKNQINTYISKYLNYVSLHYKKLLDSLNDTKILSNEFKDILILATTKVT